MLMDGMEDKGKDNLQGKGVVVVTMNQPDAIDPVLRRPGQSNREIKIGESTTYLPANDIPADHQANITTRMCVFPMHLLGCSIAPAHDRADI